MIMQFTKDEKDKLTKTLSLVVEDLRSIYNIAETNKLSYEFEVWENERLNKYSLVINKKEMYLTLHCSDWYMNLDKVKPGGKVKICPIKDYNLAFLFLQKYETIRKKVVSIASVNKTNKEQGMETVKALFNKYTKEATIEVELPETNNKPVLEVRSEEGKNVGRVTIGPVSLKILTSENVSIVDRNQQAKVKRK